MLSNRAIEVVENSNSNSFAIDLKKWFSIMKTYENGGHAYHTTMPTDSLTHFRDTMLETQEYGFDKLYKNQWELGNRVRDLLKSKNIKSVAADGFRAPGVVVSYTSDENIHNGLKFKELGMQIAAGVPLMCDEPKSFQTFRIGLFGLDKLYNVDRTIDKLEKAFDSVL
jgi:aspartate aminotransferase-like enzyme